MTEKQRLILFCSGVTNGKKENKISVRGICTTVNLVKWQCVIWLQEEAGSRGLTWICITFMWTERPAAASLLGGWCLRKAHTDGCCDWIQIRCLREAELHGNEGFLRDHGHVDPSLPAATKVYRTAEQTERLSHC